MAKEYKKSKIQDTEGSGFGTYDEYTGGGHPFEAGNSNTRTTRENGKYRDEHNNSSQPRDRMGHFTYASVNGGSIDPKYGPSRGKTVNPLLTGGDGTIKIADVAEQFESQSGEYWDKYKDSWYTEGGEFALGKGKNVHVRIAGKAIWDLAKESYDKVHGEFQGESHNFDEVKKGRPSIEESAARKQAKKSGEAPVISKESGGIKVKDIISKLKSQQSAAPTKAEEPSSPAPEAPTTSAEEHDENAPTSEKPSEPMSKSGKYTQKQLDFIKSELKASGDWDPDWEDEAVFEEALDELGGQEMFKGTPYEYSPAKDEFKENSEKDSESIKKIKEMGFSE